MIIIIKEIKYQPTDDIIQLLLLADPDLAMIEGYMNDSRVFIYETDQGQVIGIVAVKSTGRCQFELMNVSVSEKHQGQGIGQALIHFCLDRLAKETEDGLEVIVKTGDTSDSALKLYQKTGFKTVSINKNYFIDHYKDPIYENGRQLFDQVILKQDIMGIK